MFTMMLGKVDELEGHFVGTEFFAFIGPIFPVRSMYVTHETFERRGNVSVHRWEGIDIPLHWKSVVLGYLRVWLIILAFVSPFILMWEEPLDFERPEWLVTLGLFVAWILALAVPGRLSKNARARLEVLRQVTGVGLDPRRLDPFARMTKVDVLAEELTKQGFPMKDPKTIEGAVAGTTPEMRMLLFVHASHAAIEDAQWRGVREAAWRAISSAADR